MRRTLEHQLAVLDWKVANRAYMERHTARCEATARWLARRLPLPFAKAIVVVMSAVWGTYAVLTSPGYPVER